MSRLIKLLLNERNTLKYTHINGSKYVKYSYKVNLLRILLMMETLTDFKKFPTRQKFEKILSTSLNLEILTKIKRLSALYTPIVTSLKKGKKASEIKSLKEKFYKKFFPILLSELDINLNSITLTKIFARSRHGTLNQAQIKYILKLIKAIQKQELTQKDKQELLNIKNSLTDEIEDETFFGIKKEISDKTSNEIKEQNNSKNNVIKNLEQKFRDKTDEELIKKIEQFDHKIDLLTSDKTVKESEQFALEQEFEHDVLDFNDYISAKFNFVKNNSKNLNKIIKIRELLKQALLNQTFNFNEKKNNKIKKFIITLVADVIEGMIKHIPEFINNSNIVPEIIFNENNLEIMLKLSDPTILEEDFNYVRSIKLNSNGDLDKIKHEYFILPPEAQGSGISKEIIADNLRLYKAAGINKIELHANLSLGGYVWLRYGFRPYPDQLEKIKTGFLNVTKSVRYGLQDSVQVGITADMAFEGLVQHFQGSGLDTYLLELKTKFNEIYKKIQKIENKLDFDSSFSNEKIILTAFHNIVADQLEKIAKKIISSFKFTLETLPDDISLKFFEINLNKKIKIEFDFSSRLASLPSRMHAQEIAKIEQVLKNEINSTIKANKKGKATLTIELSNSKAKISVKKWLTIPGIYVDNNKKLQAFPAGNYVTGEAWSLNWKGSLDLNDSEQYNRALEYATIK